MSTDAYLRVLIVGGGRMARHHAGAVAKSRVPARVTAVADPDAAAREQMATVCGDATLYDSVEAALQGGQVDVVHVCTPPHTHEAVARAALAAGCHVYVEKPFTPTTAGARELLAFAESNGLKVCAGHQLLYEAPAREALRALPALGNLVHVESYFSFRTVRQAANGAAIAADEQLLDILPHPVYLLLEFLAVAEPDGETRLASIERGPGGTLHALLKRRDRTGTLVVTLEGRPVESYVRLAGTNGTLHADFVRGTVQRLFGPGASAIDKLVNPFRLGLQLFTGTTAALFKRVVRRQRSYPGLTEIFEAFYESIRTRTTSPTSPASILDTVEICETLARALRQHQEVESAARDGADRVVVTGGTGFLGQKIVNRLLATGHRVRVLSRRVPASWERIAGAEYVSCDLSRPIDAAVFSDAGGLIHAAAETAGGWEQHQRNSVDATEHVIRAAAEAGVRRVIHVSSLAVLATPTGRRAAHDDGPLEPDERGSGPYVWGKLTSEVRARELAQSLDVELRVVRPGALVDYSHFDPPGRLGKRVGNVFVAVGSRRDRLGVVDVSECADVIVWMLSHVSEVPETVNVLAPELPTKRALVRRLRRFNPGLRVVWLPRFLLVPMSWGAILLQKALRPGRPAINVAKVFARRRYDTSRIADLVKRVRADDASGGSAAVPAGDNASSRAA